MFCFLMPGETKRRSARLRTTERLNVVSPFWLQRYKILSRKTTVSAKNYIFMRIHLIIIYPSKPHVMSCMLFRLIHRHSILQTLSWNLFADVADMMPWLMMAKAMVLPSAEVR